MSHRPATQKQFDLIKRLVGEKALTEEQAALVEIHRGNATRGTLTAAAASGLIDLLMNLPRSAADKAAQAATPEGMHLLDGQVYKVQVAVHGSGRPYAKVLVVEATDCGGCEHCDGEGTCVVRKGSFQYAGGAIRRLSEATLMTLEQAKNFGALYGVCCRCGATLTAEDSIDRNMGPVCFSKMGGTAAPKTRTLDEIQAMNASRFD